jgi:hypothetical protein
MEMLIQMFIYFYYLVLNTIYTILCLSRRWHLILTGVKIFA